ncbi:unnamed protein product [Closterium sp. Yama58-4]|nr:unnamed protein product [Closterium sp. Yama58-4]
MPSADTAKPGVEKVVRTVTEMHQEVRDGGTKEGAGDFAASGAGGFWLAAVMRESHRVDLRAILLEKEAQLEAYLKGENERLHLLAGVREETKGEIELKVLSAKKPDFGKTLGREEEAELELDWSEEEVKEALKGMACGKSPGNDGLPKELFERHWDLLKGDFMGFVQKFEETTILPEEVQEAVTILLHKKGPKELVQNYRPITLLTSSYKVVAKMLANRMKKVLGRVISEE